ncbi:hypothetical protein NE237_003882 [Protea cynaroides]|uniref:Uncharacterized protein n=1 Tax=Protea cynaroides TaxID=273540 RepID=A0A9Q0QT08_9MAGN|nr:hypothetical protein NE237_003882 [Protea cynaroides]
MAAKPLTSEAIARTEKKMDMTLDDIIKMSKKPDFKFKNQRVPNKNQKFLNVGSNKGNASKVHRFMDSRSSIRQGVFAQRRSNFQGNQFPLATEAAKKAAAARSCQSSRSIGAPPAQWRVSERGFPGKASDIRPLFANMKEQRMRALSHSQQMNSQRTGGFQQREGAIQQLIRSMLASKWSLWPAPNKSLVQ